jgi:hypothetical protein
MAIINNSGGYPLGQAGGTTGTLIGNPPWSTTTTTTMTDMYHQQVMRLTERIRELEKYNKPLTDDRFTNIEDPALILELIARGYQVSKPPAGE